MSGIARKRERERETQELVREKKRSLQGNANLFPRRLLQQPVHTTLEYSFPATSARNFKRDKRAKGKGRRRLFDSTEKSVSLTRYFLVRSQKSFRSFRVRFFDFSCSLCSPRLRDVCGFDFHTLSSHFSNKLLQKRPSVCSSLNLSP